MLKLAGSSLNNFGTRDERQDDICRESLLEVRLDAEGVGSVDEDTGMLRGDDGFDNGRDIIHIGQSLYTEQNVVKRSL